MLDGMPRPAINVFAQHPRNRQRGSTLVAVMVVLVAAAGLVAAIYVIASGSARTAAGQSAASELDAFALGTLNICPDLVDRFLGAGEYDEGSIPPLVTSGGFTITQVDTNAAAEITGSGPLAPTDPWFLDYAGGVWDPEYEVSDGRFIAQLDLDRLRNLAQNPDCNPRSGGGFVQSEFGTYGYVGGAGSNNSAGCYLGIVRCLVVASDKQNDPEGRSVIVYAYDRKYD